MTIIDTPEGIATWRYLSAVSQLSLEISTGMNYYGKTSVLTALCNQGVFPAMRATKKNKLIALATLVDNMGDDDGPVVTRAREVIAQGCDELGIELVPVS